MENKENKRQVLVVVEGAKTDVRLMKRLFDIYGLSARHTIVPYKTNIHELFERMFVKMDPDSVDTLQFFKEHEKDSEIKKIFDEKYSDILLIFDFDPQDDRFSSDAVIKLEQHFNESTENGKLYFNYPMVEAFYHVKSIPDLDFNNRIVEKAFLDKKTNPEKKTYKQIVNNETCATDFSKFPVTRKESNIIIKQNIEKARMITNSRNNFPEAEEILESQINLLNEKALIYVLSTCGFYIYDYNPKLLEEE